jgi:mycoredoxin
MQVPYVWFDIDQNPQAAEFVQQVNRGLRRVPTIIFPDGTILVEPDSKSLRAKLRSFQPK